MSVLFSNVNNTLLVSQEVVSQIERSICQIERYIGDTTSCDTSNVLFTFKINTDNIHPNVKVHVSQMYRLLFAIQAKYYLHLKLTRTRFTQMLKNIYHKC